ncbi:hypothetical protein [Apilactobacillus timberlakei]|uniref:Uncharacterized protein n=1 Tax=Apilactobacillus timberlakei TaxID=2008380 RepID=A0ABY2YWG1_9LACO|nr:hypothetical protein [Apilactobacillus timberlakei]TPR12781.1 hypothetical protein DY048_07160 [Apilactobacillus timberlakei]TPR13664.1 hypothetical protein DY052_08030 [Apilactobacillus timberlakei]
MKKFIYLLLAVMTIDLGSASLDQPAQAHAEQYVYVTKTGKRYFTDPNDRGLKLGHAKKLYKISLSQARAEGFTRSATEGGNRAKHRHINRSYYKHVRHYRHHRHYHRHY